MRITGIGHLVFAIGFIVVGAFGIVAHDFVLSQQPVPEDIPWRETLAVLSGALLLLTGAGMLIRPTASVSAFVLSAFLLLWVLALQLPRVAANPGIEGRWLGVGEDLSLATGGWLIFCAIAGRTDLSVTIARVLFGLSLIPIGLSHFFYLQSCIQLLPTWVPIPGPLSLIAGAGHIAAGIAIALGIVPRLAATLEAVMETLFTLIVWVSAVAAAPADRQSWVNLAISATLSAAAAAVAESYNRVNSHRVL